MCRRTMPLALLAGLICFAFTSAALAQDAKPTRVAGKLTKIDGKALTIANEDGSGDVVITCDDATKYRRDGDPQGAERKFEDLQVGQNVRSYYTKATGVAGTVIIAGAQQPPAPPQPNPANTRLAGKLTKIDGKALTIAAEDGSGDVVITCGDSTKYRKDGDPQGVEHKFEDLAVGQMVRSYYNKTTGVVGVVIIAKAP